MSMGTRKRRRSILDTVKATLKSRYLLCFPDVSEVRLLQVLGGSTLTIGRIKRDGKPFTIIFSQGKLLKSENFRRIAYENRTALFMNDINQIIAIRDYDYDRNVVRYMEEEERLMAQGYRVKYIPRQWLDNNPIKALQSVQHFIYS